ncbi:MAG TPA: histidine kinase, partial [Actinomycetota bacterium]|nr:histidine kinase [Actinomycetota bacterium]
VGVGALVGRRGGLVLPGVAAAAVALAFQPARQRARHLANRLVYGKRATPYEVLSDFSDRLGEAYAFEDVLPRMADLVREGTGSVSATVWVRVGGEMRPAATSPARAGVDPARVAVDDDALPELPGERALAVRHRGDLLGALTVSKSRGDPITPAEEKLLSDLAAQAGLVLRNVRLTEELKANLEELRASRQRIVAAQDEERRRIERNIHDGAQQQLVAMRVRLRLAQTLAAKDPAKAERMLEQLQGEMADALENLRDLARGIYPPLLADAGLAAAVESQARKSPVPVAVEADGIGRYGRDVEAAVYFCVLEAVQNASKYAGEAHVRVRLFQRNGELAFGVEDDGPGFDVATTPRGSGLQNMADRIEALGGTLEIRSAPEQGTVVAGRVPAEGIAT